jgi:ABC-2 type transport system ATP-binding protein
MSIIETHDLVRQFKKTRAVDGISFSIEKGEIFGFLGPNGAGKTTTINMLSTLLRPSSGRATVCGHDITRARDKVRRSIGVVFQEPALDTRLTGAENLFFHSMLYGMRRDDRTTRTKELLSLVELTDKTNAKVSTYSGGMKRRLEIARGLMHRPAVLFLDEPTIGLDAQTRRHIWEYVKKLNREIGISMMLTTHYMEEADFLCDRILIIDHGRIVALDTPANLKNVLGGDVVELSVEGDCGQAVKPFTSIPWVKSATVQACTVRLTMERGETRIPELMELARDAQVRISSVSLHKPSLDDVFIHYTGGSMRDQAGA